MMCSCRSSRRSRATSFAGKGPRRGSVTVTAKPLREAYIFKANLWIAVFSFVGNYWYTHYFYGVLNARYTFDAHRLNDVPIALYFMTHAYFMFYHVLSNCALRKTRRAFAKDAKRCAVECALVVVMAYTTAFMESLTICGFPYYSFEDRDMAYTREARFTGSTSWCRSPCFRWSNRPPRKRRTRRRSGKPWGVRWRCSVCWISCACAWGWTSSCESVVRRSTQLTRLPSVHDNKSCGVCGGIIFY